MKNLKLDFLEDEKIKIENAFNQIIEKYKKNNAFFKINKNDRHFVELVSKGHTLFARYYQPYDDSTEGSYLEIGILNGVLIDGKKDILASEIIVIKSKSYNFSLINDAGWIGKNEKDGFYVSKNLVEFWVIDFFEIINLI